jgi:hypothetical protein
MIGFGFIIQFIAIEFIYVDDFADFQFTGKQDRFDYLGESGLVFVRIIAEVTEQDSDQVLKKAWSIWRNILTGKRQEEKE